MVTRKSSVVKEKQKELPKVAERKVDPKIKIATLADAILEGKLDVPVESEIIVEKKMNGRQHRSICVVKKIEEGLVTAWDETLNRWYLFNPAETEKHGIVVKVLKLAASSS